MGKLTLEITEEPIVGNAGLAAMGELMRISDIDSTCAKRESPNYLVAERDILRKRSIRPFLRCLSFLSWFIPQEDDHGHISSRGMFREGGLLV